MTLTTLLRITLESAAENAASLEEWGRPIQLIVQDDESVTRHFTHHSNFNPPNTLFINYLDPNKERKCNRGP